MWETSGDINVGALRIEVTFKTITDETIHESIHMKRRSAKNKPYRTPLFRIREKRRKRQR